MSTDSARIESRAAAWLARRDCGDWDTQAQDALEAWLAQATAHRIAFLRLEAAWEQSGRLAALGAGVAPGTVPPRGAWSSTAAPPTAPAAAPGPGADLSQVVFAPRPARSHRRWPALLAGAAVLLLALGVAGAGWRHYAVTESASYASALGQLQPVALSDGSRATLSSDSLIEVALSAARRRIALKRGEAYFEVAKDADRPFVVEAGERRAVAVGTRFSVRRDGATTRVVVTEGTVRLESDDHGDRPAPTTLLPAGSIAIAGPDGVLVRSVPVAEAEAALDWRGGLLSFRDTALGEAVAEFNRYNAHKLVVADARAAALRVSGTFQWDNADGFVRLLERGFPVHAERRPGTVLLHSR
ncbi:FecR family protein [Pseudoxanthomonas winnipegensis]|uniref:Histidine kinase n=1 Tax=Pseudoxanthomonas winnipegensis TaxID=2480810 RepID=A0A4Q8L9C7_9GAMM|nr:FecR domain-containing protein [Pseudoxanthomonas winnipegensis]RZZ81593.1 histidine kinase [Pseudoxanthomonas winnipegensis]TAA24707.1 histidine kinase [Pseudoxanthomonas winnipegensis]TAA39959.1 histidine kinase [Pseudoxanthomonas winnipegensis]TBV74587.1 histidine kinase [Pseudoxanthomonas winnipegensis]